MHHSVGIMKYFNIFIVVFALLIGCRESNSQTKSGEGTASETLPAYSEVGEALDETPALHPKAASDLFASLQETDTVQAVIRAQVLEVCQAKGCWMKLALADQRTVMVRFKDYGFFVPKDLAGSEVTVAGKAFVSTVSEEDRQHLAEDAGASEAEIAALKGAVQEPGFEAHGVRIWE